MLERFTEKSINAIISAQDLAKILSHDKLYPLHLFAGIVSLRVGILARILKVTGVNIELLRSDVEELLKDKKTSKVPEIMPFSNEVRDILDKSWGVSKNLGTNYIGPEHIFFVLVQNENVLKIFRKYEIDIERIICTLTRIVEKKSPKIKHPEGTKTDCENYFSLPSIFNEPAFVEIMNKALEKMREQKLEALGTEQILQAILETSDLKDFLEQEKLTKEKVKTFIENQPNRDSEFIPKNIFCTPKLYNVINKAYSYAKEFGSTTILPEHVMLGILSEKHCMAFNTIKNITPSTDSLFEKIIKPIEKQKPTAFTILSLAKEEARRLGHQMLGTELILLGILAEGAGIGAMVLSELGITIKDVRMQIEKTLGYGSDYQDIEIHYTSRAKRLLEMAWLEAKKQQKPRIESEHLLLAIIKLRDCIAMKVLTRLGVDAVEIKEGITSKLTIG